MSASTHDNTSCTKCAFFDDQVVAKVEVDTGLCRFNPPVSQPSPEAHGLWPVVSGKDWCGHFSPDGASAH